MRRVIISSLSLVLIFPGLCCKKETKTVQPNGVVSFISGIVTIEKQGAKTPAKIGDNITEGMKIITGDKSIADIIIGENGIKIVENTILEISKLFKDDKSEGETTDLTMSKGKIFSRVGKKLIKGDSFQVITPTAVAAIRGTDFVVSEIDGKSNVACLKGKVQVKDATKADSKPVELNAGQEVNVEKGKTLTVQDLKEENLKNMQKIIEDINEIKQDIRKKFETQRDEIKKAVQDQKDSNRELIDKQKQENRENMDKVKDSGKENIQGIKSDFGDKKEGIGDSVKKFEKPDLKGVKPKIEKDSIK